MDSESLSDAFDEPTYNLKAVVRETGLKGDTLRAWERRYGLPEPRRTESGHRLYSARDVAILKWLSARQEEGLTISRAVALWQRLLDEGIDPIDESEIQYIESPTSARSVSFTPSMSSPSPQSTKSTSPFSTRDGHLQALREQWLLRCLSFDEAGAEDILEQAFSTFSIETVCIDLLFKGIAEMGTGWSEGRITAQQEHFSSSLAIRRLHALHNGTPQPTKPRRIVIGCPPDEEHVFASMLTSLLIRRRGWDVVYLGANVPQENLASTLSTVRPDLVILTAQQLHTAGTLLEMGNILFEHGVPLAYGGAIFSRAAELHRCIPGYYLGDDIGAVPQLIDQIMSSPRIKSATQKVPIEHILGLRNFRENRGRIEDTVWHQLAGEIERRSFDELNSYLARNIIASFTLCKCSYVEAELQEIGTLLVNYFYLESEVVDKYLHCYLMGAQHHLTGDGQVVFSWLASLLSQELSFDYQ